MAGAGGRAQRGRLHALSAIFVGVGLVLAYRLIDLQLIQHERFSALAREEHLQTESIPPRRGALLDTNGRPLAVSVQYDSLHLVGSEIGDPDQTAASLAPLLGLRPEEIRLKIDPQSKTLVPLKSRISSAAAAQVQALRLPGVYWRPDSAREYPEGSIAPQVVGFVGLDGKGLAGIEFSYEEELAGQPGLLRSERDTTGQEIAPGRRVLVEPRHGADLVLTLDGMVQRLAERSLAEAVAANKASGGLILVMEPTTGAVLAMASRPTYNLTDDVLYKPGQDTLYKTVPITNQYEPGSVMKVITMAAGLEEKRVTPNSTVNDTGSIEVGGAVLRNWDHRANGVISMTRVLIHSSNIGAQYVSGLLGPERFYGYLDAFGFGKPTGIRLPGESPGSMRTPADPGWGRIDLATNSYGQGVAVTPLQMLNATSAVANGGVLMRPQIVRQVRRDGRVETVQAEPIRQVISAATADTLSEMMVQVLEQPALEPYRVPGYRFAGKTGTADLPTNLGYTSGKTYASVVAFGPMPSSKFSILIRIDAPEAIYGGVVAAPVLKKMALELVSYYRLPASPARRETTRP
jgi:cell division protein FtsI (penicillin-binding protein 3)